MEPRRISQKEILEAFKSESQKFQNCYLWLEEAMTDSFFEELSAENMMLVAHSLMGFPLQEYYATINLKSAAIVLCLDSPDADITILSGYASYGIKDYRAFISTKPAPFPEVSVKLRVAVIYFTEAVETSFLNYPKEFKEQLRDLIHIVTPQLSDAEFDRLICSMNARFLRSLPIDRLALALNMFFRAKTRDSCQYELYYNEDWDKDGEPVEGPASMQIVLAWRNTPKQNFLYRVAKVIHRHRLAMRKVNATYVNPYSKDSILIMAIGLHGSNGEAAWQAADIIEFLRDLVTVKYFDAQDILEERLVNTGIIPGTMANMLRCMVNFIHQVLVHLDPNLYTIENITLDLCRHPDITARICEAFKYKFHPDEARVEKFTEIRDSLLPDIKKLDTGHVENDIRRRNVLRQAINMVSYTLKTNFYRRNYTALSFRLDPKYLDETPYNRSEIFPELPFGIFFIQGMHFFGFHIRFKDLSRGGLRTVFPQQLERMVMERNTVFRECYNLAYTQHKKNKDIPEGGSKGIIFLRPFDQLELEAQILKRELTGSSIDPKEIEYKLLHFREEQKEEYLYHAQRSFIENFLSIINCEPNGKLRAKYIADYWRRPEYIYLGPDENMFPPIIQWIADYSVRHHYLPGSSFISSKPKVGINHKQYGVTSLGVNVYMHEVLTFLGIDPAKDPFTIKMSGGPDGDVAGNQICNLRRFYPKTAKLVALTDISGTINDPDGLDLDTLVMLFKEQKPIKYYPPEKLHEGGYLLDKNNKRHPTALVQQTLCWKKIEGKLEQIWLSGSEMNYLYRNNIHSTPTDVFIPSGGRPRTLNEQNYQEYLDPTGKPTSKAIIEGANLYLTQGARRALEKLGTIIIKDSSANKTGVICSSFEVLCGLALGDDLFLKHKEKIVEEILTRIQLCAYKEASLLLKTYKEDGEFLTDISEAISKRINMFAYQLLDYLDTTPLPDDPNHPLLRAFFNYCPPILRNQYRKELMKYIPEHHKKAIISCHIAASLVYNRGLKWFPSIVDILPLILAEVE